MAPTTKPAAFRLLDLPREIIRLICLHVYDPLDLTQQDRLTWGIFSTVDMHAERQSDLASLIKLGWTCRKVRREARVVLFRCVRVNEVSQLEELVKCRESWGKYVRSIIIDLNMFDTDEYDHPPTPEELTLAQMAQTYWPGTLPMRHPWEIEREDAILPRRPRSCWAESAQLVELIRSLPFLQHLCIFADASDDAALALFFSSLITHPSLHHPPPPLPTRSTISTPTLWPATPPNPSPAPFASRLTSFGWRQRAPPPAGFRQYAQVSTFVSTHHLIRHAYRLSSLVLDADMDEMDPQDVLTVCRELRRRPPPRGEQTETVSLTLCGPIRGWEEGFLGKMVAEYQGFKELFVDRPLRKSHMAHETSVGNFTDLLQPLTYLPRLRLLQVGSYTWSPDAQLEIVHHLIHIVPSLLVVGLLNEQGQTSWWGLWRRSVPHDAEGQGVWMDLIHYGRGTNARDRDRDGSRDRHTDAEQGMAGRSRGQEDQGQGVWVVPLGEGHLRMLEDEANVHDAARSASGPGVPNIHSQPGRSGGYASSEREQGMDVDMADHDEADHQPKSLYATHHDYEHQHGRGGSVQVSGSKMSLRRLLSE